MREYQLRYHARVVDDDIPRLGEFERAMIRKAINQKLTAYPERYGKPLRNTLKGLWSLRIGDWRVIYKITGDVVHIVKIRHRRWVYQGSFT